MARHTHMQSIGNKLNYTAGRHDNGVYPIPRYIDKLKLSHKFLAVGLVRGVGSTTKYVSAY